MPVVFSGAEKARIAEAARIDIMTVDNWVRKAVLDACSASESKVAKRKPVE